MAAHIRQSTAIKKNGFTLAELMIAVGIIAILTIAGLVTMQNQTQRARDQRRQADLEAIRQALEEYRLSIPNHTYPISVTAGPPDVVLLATLDNFMPSIPRDPLRSTHYKYAYRSLNNGMNYELCARLETLPAGGNQLACGAPLRCGAVSGENCNIITNQDHGVEAN